ncbi:hypothetical protein HAX54_037256, partial [Datura stramonium]|nr:hypothetical protein [Datura stramonium]
GSRIVTIPHSQRAFQVPQGALHYEDQWPKLHLYNECRGCKHKCRAEQVPVEGNDPMKSPLTKLQMCLPPLILFSPAAAFPEEEEGLKVAIESRGWGWESGLRSQVDIKSRFLDWGQKSSLESVSEFRIENRGYRSGSRSGSASRFALKVAIRGQNQVSHFLEFIFIPLNDDLELNSHKKMVVTHTP